MAITPQTNLKLLKCHLNLDNSNQLNFSSKTTQYEYFNGLTKLEASNFTYQRKDNVIRYPAHIDSIIEYNYVMYQNSNYTNKWFYAYIVRMVYVNDGLTDIYIKTDPYQTWQFDITFMRSFVEREHVNDDTVGLHTVPESLETGEYICNSRVKLYEGDSNTTICALCSDIPDEVQSTLSVTLNSYNSIFNGCYILVFDPENTNLAISNFLRAMDKLNKADAVVSIFLVPTTLVNGSVTYTVCNIDVGSGQTITTKCGALPTSSGAVTLATSTAFTVPTTLNGYTPKNNKLRTYPYSYFYISNNAGSDINFNYEDFASGSVSFKTLGAITPGCSIRCVPLNYKKLADTSSSTNSFNAGISVAKYPICAWKSDTYINWLTENGVNLSLQIAGGVLSAGVGVATIIGTGGAGALAGGGMVAGGLGAIINAIASDYQHSLIPDQAKGNTNTGDVVFSSGNLDVVAYKMSVRSEYAQIIDGFFSMYGYKVNTSKVPNLTGRTNWNYVKCIDVNIEGYIPQEDLQELKGMFNEGITIWHNPTTFLDYSQNNAII